MYVTVTHAAGLDVHKKTVVACALTLESDTPIQSQTRTFGTMTADLLALVDWLLARQITHVVMESTGEYWKPIYQLLEAVCTVWVVNAQHVKQVPGRKTDVTDAAWLADLLQHGLLRPSFIPPQPQRDLRDLTRQRTILVQERTAVMNRLHKVLEWANLKLTAVVSDVTGVSARAMLEALLAGERDPVVLADLAKSRLRSKRAALAQALQGRLRDHHCFLLTQHLAHIDFLDEQIALFDEEIGRQLQAAAATSEPLVSASPATAAVETADAITQQIQAVAAPTGELVVSAAAPTAPTVIPEPTDRPPVPPPSMSWQRAVELLDTIPGVGRKTAEMLVAEIGSDMSRFPSAGHLASWAKVAPGNHESAGKRLSGKTGKGNPWLRSGLVQAAWAAVRTKESYLGAVYKRLVRRRGVQRAIIAIAHRIIVAIYYMLRRDEEYEELGANYRDEQNKEQVVRRMQRRIERLGYQVTVAPAPPAA